MNLADLRWMNICAVLLVAAAITMAIVAYFQQATPASTVVAAGLAGSGILAYMGRE